MMGNRIKLLSVAVLSIAVAACSIDEANQPHSNAQSSRATNASKNKTRSGDVPLTTGFAGFGRVGRSPFSDADYRARWAVIVGINQFNHMGDLDNAANDARAIRDMLRDEFGYEKDRIIFLSDQVINEKAVSEKAVATNTDPIKKGDLLKAFADLASRDIRVNDSVLFFFAGHGKSDADGAYLAGFDALPNDLSTWVDVNDIKQRLAAVPARHKLVILDSCYAGSILRVDLSKEQNTIFRTPSPIASTGEAAATRSGGDEAMELRDNLAYYLREPAFLAITSGRDQPAGDASAARPDHSPFTTSLLAVLRERANSVRVGDVFTARELAVRVESLVRKGQTPDWGRLSGGRGDFVFKPTRDRLTPRERAVRDDYGLKIAFADILTEKINANFDTRTNRQEITNILDACSKELRGCEWYRLHNRLRMSLRTFGQNNEIVDSFSTGASVICVAVSPDGKRFASGEVDQDGNFGSYFGTIKVWDMEQGDQPILSFRAHDSGVSALAFSRDGKFIYSGTGGGDGEIKKWDANHDPKQGGNVKPIWTGEPEGVSALSVSPDGNKLVYAAGEDAIVVRDAASGKRLLKWKAHESEVFTVAFNSDGSKIASGGKDGSINLWDANRGGDPLSSMKPPGRLKFVTAVVFGPTDKIILSGFKDGSFTIWDLEKNGELKATVPAHPRGITSMAFSHDGQRLMTASEDKTIKIWGKGLRLISTLYGHDHAVVSIAVESKFGRIISGSLDGTVKLWSGKNIDGNAVFVAPIHNDEKKQAVAFSPDAKRMVIGGREHGGTDKKRGILRVRKVDGNHAMIHDLIGHGDLVRAVAFSQDGRFIASGGDDNLIKVWDAQRGGAPLMTLKGHGETILSVAFSPDGKHIVSGSYDNTIRLWDVERKAASQVKLNWIGGTVQSVAFSPDGSRILAGGTRITASRVFGNIQMWDAARGGEALFTLPNGAEDVRCVAFSRDGKRIVSGGARLVSGETQGLIKVWDAHRGGPPLAIMRGHRDNVTGVAFTVDGRRIISCSPDGTVKAWDAERYGNAMANLLDSRRYEFWSLAIDADGRCGAAVNSSSLGGVLLWDDRE